MNAIWMSIMNSNISFEITSIINNIEMLDYKKY